MTNSGRRVLKVVEVHLLGQAQVRAQVQDSQVSAASQEEEGTHLHSLPVVLEGLVVLVQEDSRRQIHKKYLSKYFPLAVKVIIFTYNL